MKRGHCTGRKREKEDSQDWYKEIEQANIERIEREWAAKEAAKRQAA